MYYIIDGKRYNPEKAELIYKSKGGRIEKLYMTGKGNFFIIYEEIDQKDELGEL